MKEAILYRFNQDGVTQGVLSTGDAWFCTLELPWLNNQNNTSCVPRGKYLCSFLKRSASGKYRDVWHVQDVEGRSGILIHNGNVAAHTRGCILLGMRSGYLRGKPAVLNSRTAMYKFNQTMGEEPFYLTITGEEND